MHTLVTKVRNFLEKKLPVEVMARTVVEWKTTSTHNYITITTRLSDSDSVPADIRLVEATSMLNGCVISVGASAYQMKVTSLFKFWVDETNTEYVRMPMEVV